MSVSDLPPGVQVDEREGVFFMKDNAVVISVISSVFWVLGTISIIVPLACCIGKNGAVAAAATNGAFWILVGVLVSKMMPTQRFFMDFNTNELRYFRGTWITGVLCPTWDTLRISTDLGRFEKFKKAVPVANTWFRKDPYDRIWCLQFRLRGEDVRFCYCYGDDHLDRAEAKWRLFLNGGWKLFKGQHSRLAAVTKSAISDTKGSQVPTLSSTNAGGFSTYDPLLVVEKSDPSKREKNEGFGGKQKDHKAHDDVSRWL